MNGIHDMGGMQGLGEIGYHESEPGFHEAWEVRVFALVQAMRSGGLRPYIERIPAADYLRMSYYERWYTALVTRLIESGVVTRAEVERSSRSGCGAGDTGADAGGRGRVALQNPPDGAGHRAAATVSCRRSRARTEHPSDHAHAYAAVHARQNGCRGARSRRLPFA